MILLDANLLLYAYNSSAEIHSQAASWLEQALNGNEQVGIPLTIQLAFLRISTNRKAFVRPLAMERAIEIVDSWRSRNQVVTPQPGEEHWKILTNLMVECQVKGPLVSDAHLAALAIEHGATLYSTDHDFSRFDQLKFVNPLRQGS